MFGSDIECGRSQAQPPITMSFRISAYQSAECEADSIICVRIVVFILELIS